MDTNNNNDIDPVMEKRLSRILQGQSTLHDVKIPEHVDRIVLAIADSKAKQIQNASQTIRVSRMFRWSAAAAALVLITIGTSLTILHQTPTNETPSVAVLETTHPADILDAYMLASKIAEGTPLSLEYDYNHDGRVDHADVEQLARKAVSIAPVKNEKDPGNV